MRSLHFIQTDDIFTMISRCSLVPDIFGLLQPKIEWWLPLKKKQMANTMDQILNYLQDMHKIAQRCFPTTMSNIQLSSKVSTVAAGCCTDPCSGVFETP